jgi:simple sugar transport system ATP-binding protein
MPQVQASKRIDEGLVATTPLLEVSHVTKQFGGVKALDDVHFDIMPGEVLCLAGENGCGKSTLIKIITGVYQPEAGAAMRFAGQNIEGLSPATARDLGIQVIWQDLALFPEMSVAENIGFERNLGARPRFVNYSAMKTAAKRILDRLGVTLDLNAPLRSLPIAQRQIVAVARALVTEAKLVFMDEPTASLSQAETDALLVIVRRLSAEGIAIVFVSHRLAEVLDVCTRVTVFRDGKLVGTFPTTGMTQTRLTELMTGKTFDYVVSNREMSDRPAVLEVDHLSRPGQYEDVSLTIHEGEIVGLTGRLGSGRTELALSLFGMTAPSSGEFRILGKPAQFGGNRDAIRAGIAYVSEDRLTLGLIQPQSIEENAVISVLDTLLDPVPFISFRKRDALVAKWIRDLGVKIGKPSNAISTLSGGNQQKVVLAKWLEHHCEAILFDEPTRGIDVGAKYEIYQLINVLAAQGKSIVLVSSELEEVLGMADRIVVMHEGRITGEITDVPHATPADILRLAVR